MQNTPKGDETMIQIDLNRVDPRRFVTYRNNPTQCFCQVRLDSGERVLVSGAAGEIKLVKLRLGGLMPGATIATISSGQLVQLFKPMLADPLFPMKHPLDLMAMMVAANSSINELKGFLDSDPETQNTIVTAAAEGGKRQLDIWREEHLKDKT